MDSGEINKFMGAILGSLTLTMGLTFLAQGLVSPKKVEKAGYDLPSGHAAVASGAPTKAEAVEPIAARLAKADPKKGEAAVKPCQACHTFEKGGAAKMGPALYGIVGHDAGKAAGFGYSKGLAAMGAKWDFEALDKFLANPKGLIADTKMSFAGVSKPEQRADIIAYLNGNSDSPVAVPK